MFFLKCDSEPVHIPNHLIYYVKHFNNKHFCKSLRNQPRAATNCRPARVADSRGRSLFGPVV